VTMYYACDESGVVSIMLVQRLLRMVAILLYVRAEVIDCCVSGSDLYFLCIVNMVSCVSGRRSELIMVDKLNFMRPLAQVRF